MGGHRPPREVISAKTARQVLMITRTTMMISIRVPGGGASPEGEPPSVAGKLPNVRDLRVAVW